MFLKPDKIVLLAFFVFLIFMIQSSISSSLENDNLAQLIERLDRLQAKMDAMRSIMEIENDKWSAKFGDLEAENEKLKTQILKQDEEIQHLKSSKIPPPVPKWSDGQSSRLLSKPPTSCQELKNNNGLWPMDGIHLVKKNNKIQAAFCTFAADGSPASEALIGRVDVKTKLVHFYVQRESHFTSENSVIPFEVARLNEGNAFDLPSGTFTVPVNGIYYFQFSALKSNSAVKVYIFLQVNGANVAFADTQGTPGTWAAVTLNASLRLAAGDKVRLYHWLGAIYDGSEHRTLFTGWLVEEELA